MKTRSDLPSNKVVLSPMNLFRQRIMEIIEIQTSTASYHMKIAGAAVLDNVQSAQKSKADLEAIFQQGDSVEWHIKSVGDESMEKITGRIIAYSDSSGEVSLKILPD
jgi:hypothetical protein